MPRFLCKVVAPDGQLHTMERTFENSATAERFFVRRGFVVDEVKSLGKGPGKKAHIRVKPAELISFTFQFRSIFASGVSLSEGLESIAEGIKDQKMRRIVLDLKNQLELGMPISQAMENYPGVFDQVYVNVIRAGEERKEGSLSKPLDHLVALLSWRRETSQQIKTASIYPVAMLIALGLVGVFTVAVLVPRFKQLFASMGIGDALPFWTRMLVGLSDFITQNTMLLGLIVLCVVGGIIWMGKARKGRYVWDWIKLKLPVAGPLVWRMGIARLSETLALLWRTGVPPNRCLKVASDVVGNKVLVSHLAQAQKLIEQGASLSRALSTVPNIPPLILRMISTGERTDDLPKALEHVAGFYNREMPYMLSRFMELVKPVIVVILAVFVFIMAMAIITPMMSLMQRGLG